LLQDMHGGCYYLVMTSIWTFKDTVLPRLLLEDLLGNSQVVGLYTERKWTQLHMCTFVQKHLSGWHDTLFAMGIARSWQMAMGLTAARLLLANLYLTTLVRCHLL
jgi:hypothetical protein